MNFEIDFLPVGQGSGDAICVRYLNAAGDGYVHIVDGGHTDTAVTIIEHVTRHYYAKPIIAHMVLTHADDDHARGLVPVLEAFDVRNFWMNRPWQFAEEVIGKFNPRWKLDNFIAELRSKHPYLVDLEKIAARKGTTQIHDVFQGQQIGQFLVLAPSRERYLRLIPRLDKTPEPYVEDTVPAYAGTILETITRVTNTETFQLETLSNSPPVTRPSNETSVVQLGIFGDRHVLLTGDVGPEGLLEAAVFANSRGLLRAPDFVQIPHHGSRRNVTPGVLDIWLGSKLPYQGAMRRGLAFCSVGENKTDEYPRKRVRNAFIRRGYDVHSTGDCSLRHQRGMSARGGTWTPCIPEPFQTNVNE